MFWCWAPSPAQLLSLRTRNAARNYLKGASENALSHLQIFDPLHPDPLTRSPCARMTVAPNHKQLFCSSNNPRMFDMREWVQGTQTLKTHIRFYTAQAPPLGERTHVTYRTATAQVTFAEMQWNDPRIGLGTVRIGNAESMPMQRLIQGRMQGEGDRASFEHDSRRYVWYINTDPNDASNKTYSLKPHGSTTNIANFWAKWRSPDPSGSTSPCLLEYDSSQASMPLIMTSIVALSILRWVESGGGRFLSS